MKHTQKTISEIRGFAGPAEGELLVKLSWGKGYDALMTVQEALKTVRDNPRIEYKAEEKWLLDAEREYAPNGEEMRKWGESDGSEWQEQWQPVPGGGFVVAVRT